MVSITGDGGFLFGGSDLATAVQFGINLVTVVVNNASYGNVLRDQQRLYEGRHSGAVLTNPDFRAYAKSFGVGAWRVETADAAPAARCARRIACQCAGADRGRLRHRQGLSAVRVPSAQVALMANALTLRSAEGASRRVATRPCRCHASRRSLRSLLSMRLIKSVERGSSA